MEKFQELLFLSNIKRVGPATINKKYVPILKNFNDFQEFLTYIKGDFDTEKLKEALDKTQTIYNQLLDDTDATAITILDDAYPEKLKVLENNAPPILYVKGNPAILSMPNIAVIGTRKPSDISKEFDYEFSQEIIRKSGRVILSGLALGCDAISHRAAVEMESETIAFLPSGISKITPASNKKLAEKILETGGCLVSTFPPEAGAFKRSYVIRDEYVAAMSDCTFVVQCGEKSGTMHTVNFAAKYGRKIACYLPDKRENLDFSGNEYILANEKYNASKITDLNETDTFLKTFETKKTGTLDDFF